VINLILFGTTTGLEIVEFPLPNTPRVSLEPSWIEVSSSQIVLRADKDGYVVRRKISDNQVITWIGLYRPAIEIGYDRPGSFYGAGAVLVDSVVDVTRMMEVLKYLAEQIQLKAMNGDRFIRKITDIRSELVRTPDISSLVSNIRKISGGCHPNGEVAFLVANGNTRDVLEWAQLAQSASAYSKLLIGSSDQVPSSSSNGSFPVLRSLSLAIEYSYQRLSSELQSSRSDFNLKVKALANLAENNTSLLRENMALEAQIKTAENTLFLYKEALQKERSEKIFLESQRRFGSGIDKYPIKPVDNASIQISKPLGSIPNNINKNTNNEKQEDHGTDIIIGITILVVVVIFIGIIYFSFRDIKIQYFWSSPSHDNPENKTEGVSFIGRRDISPIDQPSTSENQQTNLPSAQIRN
jgi:hypothetical protein